MHEMRLEQCKEVQCRLETVTIKHEERITEVEKVQAVTNSKLDDVCDKMSNQTKAIWGLIATLITTMVGFIISVVIMVIGK
jgi:hypothetical protein